MPAHQVFYQRYPENPGAYSVRFDIMNASDRSVCIGNQVMSSIKKHQCPSCGGNLTVDNDKQMYYCTFCGSTFDYEYFREEQMHEMGETYLSRGEFMAAADAYRFMLKKDPHDFTALRGLMLASAHLTDMDKLTREDKIKGFAYNTNLINEAIECASEEDKEYFKEFGRIFSDKKKLYDLNHEINSLQEDKRKLLAAVALDDIEREYYYIPDKRGKMNDPKVTFFPLVITGGILILSGLMWFIMQSDLETDWLIQALGWFCIITGIVLVGSNLIFVYPKMREIKEIDNHSKKLQAESMLIEEKVKSLESEADKLSAGIRISCHDFAKKDRLIMSKIETV